MEQIFSEIPAYSEAALGARDIFFSPYNDLFFYVEDEEQENLYLHILRNLFPQLRINQIFPLGGKTPVIAHLHSQTDMDLLKRAIYIVDKDFDDLLNRKIHHVHLFYLDRYSIENYLIEEDAMIEVAIEENPKLKREEVVKNLSYKKTKQQFLQSLLTLIRLFIVIQKYELDIKNTGLNIERFTNNKLLFKIEKAKVQSYYEKVFLLLKEAQIVTTKKQFDVHLKNSLPNNLIEIERHACGKHLLSMFQHYLGKMTGKGTIEKDSLTYRLAKNCSFLSLKHLQNQIDVILR